jgi:hypothetical protein
MVSLSGCFLIGGSSERSPIIAYFLTIGSDALAALVIDAIVSPVLALSRMFSVLSALIDPLWRLLSRFWHPEVWWPTVVGVAACPN